MDCMLHRQFLTTRMTVYVVGQERRAQMSPRKKNMLTVEGWSDLKKGRLYKAKVKKVDVNRESKSLHVIIDNLDPTQLGRLHELNLPLPIRPGNRTCSFLLACGIDASAVGKRICLDDIAGAIIGMKFGTVAQDGSQQVDFERIEDSSGTQPDTRVEDSVEGASQRQCDPG